MGAPKEFSNIPPSEGMGKERGLIAVKAGFDSLRLGQPAHKSIFGPFPWINILVHTASSLGMTREQMSAAQKTSPRYKTEQQVAFELTMRQQVREYIADKPEFLPPEETIVFAPSPYVKQQPGRGCVAANMSSIFHAIGVEITEQQLLKSASEQGYGGQDGELKQSATDLFNTSAVLNEVQRIRPEVAEVSAENGYGLTIPDLTRVALEASEQQDEVYMLASVTSEVVPTGIHNVIVKSIGPDTTIINDPGDVLGQEDKEIPTSQFIERFAMPGGICTFIRVTKSEPQSA